MKIKFIHRADRKKFNFDGKTKEQITEVYKIGKLHYIAVTTVEDDGSASTYLCPIFSSLAHETDFVLWAYIDKYDGQGDMCVDFDEKPAAEILEDEAKLRKYIDMCVKKTYKSGIESVKVRRFMDYDDHTPNVIQIMPDGRAELTDLHDFTVYGLAESYAKSESVNIYRWGKGLCVVTPSKIKEDAPYNELVSAFLGGAVFGDALICGYKRRKCLPLTAKDIADVTEIVNALKNK